jgi:hypothetical protein
MTGEGTSDTPAARGGERLLFFVALAFYLGLSLVKMKAYVAEGRFWAEEGTIFFVQFSNLPFLDRIFYLYYGHLELPTNLIVAMATLFPLKHAPFVTTHLSFLLQSIPVVMLIAFHRRIGIGRWGLLALILILVGLPQAGEVWATSTNLHFHFSLVAALIAIIGVGGASQKVTFRVLLAAAGLSGIPANFLAPVFLGLAVTTRDRERWIQFGIIATTCAIQLALLVANSAATGPRTVSLDPRIHWLAIVSQQVISPLVGIESGDALSGQLRRILANDLKALPLAVVCSLPIVLLLKEVFADKSRRLWVYALSALLLSVLSIVGSIGDKVPLISAGAGGRYFFASNVLVAMFAMLAMRADGRWWLKIFVAVLLFASVFRIPGVVAGPSWGLEYERAIGGRTEQINIWPTGWTMKNVERIPTER